MRGAGEAPSSPRCAASFKFSTNHYPIQDFYLVKVAKRADGKFATSIDEEGVLGLRRSACQRLRDEVVVLYRSARAEVDRLELGGRVGVSI